MEQASPVNGHTQDVPSAFEPEDWQVEAVHLWELNFEEPGGMWDALAFYIWDRLGGASHEEVIAHEGTDTSEGTKLITEAIFKVATQLGFLVRKEAKVKLPALMGYGIGYFDVEIKVPEGVDIGSDLPSDTLEIEIDSQPKRWSLDKLLLCRYERGCEALWVRWSTADKVYVPPGIRLIDLAASRAAQKAHQMNLRQDEWAAASLGGRHPE